jgi:uncharacterized membrane protein YvbJ
MPEQKKNKVVDMKTSNHSKELNIALVILIIILFIALMQRSNQELLLKPSSNKINKGDNLRVDILANGVKDLAGVQLSINYNPNILRYDKTVEGTFLSKGAQTLFLNTIDASQHGFIKDIVVVRLNGETSGSGVIASVYFTAINKGSSDLMIVKMLLADKDGNALNADAKVVVG